MHDKKLARLSGTLLVLAYVTALLSIIAPLALLTDSSPIVLAKGSEIWKTTLGELPLLEGGLCVFLLLLPDMVWVYAVIQIARLAHYYRRGFIFEYRNTQCFVHIGGALIVMGIVGNLAMPLVNYLFYYRHISPWLADMPLLAVMEPDLIMAGAFFYVLGKIMRRGAELQDDERLTV